ncbi:MAG TPA: GerAB/ArcD/ProY family transporter [Bacillota bacterium]|nr:GerAB/ArcD/ProY family transporter [Bacillota bacterium]
MQENIKLNREQVIFLCLLGVVGNVVYIHTWIDDFTDRSAWVAAMLGVLALIPLAIWLLFLGKFYPQQDLFTILEKGWGKLISKTLGLIFILINIAIAVAQLNMFTAMINAFFLQFTPPRIIMFTMTVVCVILISAGIQVFGRLTEVVAVLGVINFFLAFIFAFPGSVHPEYVFPIFDTSWPGFLKGTAFIAGATAEGLLALMIIVRYIPDPGKHYGWVVKGMVMGGTIITSAVLIIIAIMSPELAKRVAFGGVNAANLLQVGGFIQGLEVFLFGSYQIIALGKISLCMYCIWISLNNIITTKWPLLQLAIIALMILVPSVWLTSYIKAYFLAVFMGTYVLLPYSILILLLASASIVIQKIRAGSAVK